MLFLYKFIHQKGSIQANWVKYSYILKVCEPRRCSIPEANCLYPRKMFSLQPLTDKGSQHPLSAYFPEAPCQKCSISSAILTSPLGRVGVDFSPSFLALWDGCLPYGSRSLLAARCPFMRWTNGTVGSSAPRASMERWPSGTSRYAPTAALVGTACSDSFSISSISFWGAALVWVLLAGNRKSRLGYQEH